MILLLPVFYHKWKLPCDWAAASGKRRGIPSPPLSIVLAHVPAPPPARTPLLGVTVTARLAPWKPDSLLRRGGWEAPGRKLLPPREPDPASGGRAAPTLQTTLHPRGLLSGLGSWWRASPGSAQPGQEHGPTGPRAQGAEHAGQAALVGQRRRLTDSLSVSARSQASGQKGPAVLSPHRAPCGHKKEPSGDTHTCKCRRAHGVVPQGTQPNRAHAGSPAARRCADMRGQEGGAVTPVCGAQGRPGVGTGRTTHTITPHGALCAGDSACVSILVETPGPEVQRVTKRTPGTCEGPALPRF